MNGGALSYLIFVFGALLSKVGGYFVTFSRRHNFPVSCQAQI